MRCYGHIRKVFGASEAQKVPLGRIGGRCFFTPFQLRRQARALSLLSKGFLRLSANPCDMRAI
jgi:hypothetical protein